MDFILIVIIILAGILGILLHELTHFIIFSFQGIEVIIFSCIFFHIANRKIRFKYIGLLGSNIINVKRITNKYGKETTKRKIIINQISTNLITVVYIGITLLLFFVFKILYIRIFFLLLAIALLFVFLSSFTKYGDFSTARSLRKTDDVYYRYLCNYEIINGYSSELYAVIVRVFLEEKLIKDYINISFFINYILNYNIYNNIKCEDYLKILLMKEIKKLPNDFFERLSCKFMLYNYLVYDEKEEITFLTLKNKKTFKNIMVEPLHDFYLCFKTYLKNYEALYSKLMIKIKERDYAED